MTASTVLTGHFPVRTRPPKSRSGLALAGLTTLILIGFLAILILDIPREAVGGIVILEMLLLMSVGVPIAISMIAAGAVGLFVLGGDVAVSQTLGASVFNAAASWQLSVIPLFILMGMAMWRSGVTGRAYAAAREWLAWLPGGLAVATNFAGAGLAASSGSSVGISYALGRIAVPEMLRANYSKSLATGVVAVAGTLGQLIPPSIVLVIYAGMAQTAVGPQLLAAIVPGVLLAVAYAAMIVIRALINPKIAPKENTAEITWSTRFRSLVGVIPLAVIVFLVIGGLFSGWFTATEAAAVGAVASLAIGGASILRSEKTVRSLWPFLRKVVVETVVSTAAIFMLLIAVAVFTRIMALSRLANAFSDWLISLELDAAPFLLLLVVFFLILGMFLDPIAMMLLTFPVLSPALAHYDVDLLWFGIFLVILAELAVVSPPVGMLSFIVHRLAQDPDVNLGKRISLVDVFRGVLPFVFTCIAFIVLLIFVPDIVLWLPGLSNAQ